jgi:hypothetical protein
VQWMGWRAFEAEWLVPPPRALVYGMHEQRTDPDQLAGLHDPCHRVEQQRAAKMLTLMAGVDREATSRTTGTGWLVARPRASRAEVSEGITAPAARA